MANGHRSQIKRERNAVKDTRPSAKLSYARVSVQKAHSLFDSISSTLCSWMDSLHCWSLVSVAFFYI